MYHRCVSLSRSTNRAHLGRFLSGIAIFLLSAVFFQREYGIRFNRSYLEGLHKFCFPVYIYVILGWVVFYINSFIINYYNTTSDVGIYDFALKVVLLIDVTQTAVSATINPRIYQIWTDTGLQKKYNRRESVSSCFYHVQRDHDCCIYFALPCLFNFSCAMKAIMQYSLSFLFLLFLLPSGYWQIPTIIRLCISKRQEGCLVHTDTVHWCRLSAVWPSCSGFGLEGPSGVFSCLRWP